MPAQPPRSGPTDAPHLVLVGPAQHVPGDVIASKYRLVRLIGEGGMGTVWLAVNQTLDVEVAIKLIRRDVDTAEAGERLLQEARATAKIEHASIVRIFDFGTTEHDDPFIVMELLKGESLDDVIERKGKLSPENAVGTLLPVASALVATHSKGIVHRDLKPGNILLVQGERGAVIPKVVDFGIAKLAQKDTQSVTKAGVVLGSPEYMSPEQARGRGDIDDRTDMWALAVVLYELVTGRRPFDGENYNAVLAAIIETNPTPIAELGVADEALWAILSRALQKDRTARWPNMTAFGRALAEWALERGVEADVTGASIALTWLESQRRPLSDPPEPLTGQYKRSELIGRTSEVTAPLGMAMPVAVSALPPSLRSPPAAVLWSPSAPPRSSWPRRILLLAAVIAVGGAAAMVVAKRARLFDAPAQMSPAPRPIASATPAAPAPEVPDPAPTVAVASVAVPVSAAPETPPPPAPRVDVTSCATSQFAVGTFAEDAPPDFSWMCAESDPRRGAATLKGLVVRAGGSGPVTEAMKEWALLHWYELAAFGVVRARCCAGASPLVLPAPIGRCAPLDRAIDDLAAAANGDADFTAQLAAFRGAVHCTIASGLVADYTYKDPPPAGAEGALEKLLARGAARGR